jgi:hypothetical protein
VESVVIEIVSRGERVGDAVMVVMMGVMVGAGWN